MNSHEVWYVNIQNKINKTSFKEIIQDIKSGKISKFDKVKHEKLPWTCAENIPELEQIFGEIRSAVKEYASTSGIFDNREIYTNFQIGEIDYAAVDDAEEKLYKCCAIHPDLKPFYICTVCESLFCKICVISVEDELKICPFCGGRCTRLLSQEWTMEDKKHDESVYDLTEEDEEKEKETEKVYAKLAKEDFLAALIYPLHTPFSLIRGGLLFAVLVFGVIITAFKDEWSLWLTLGLTSIILTLKFGILTKTFENFTRGDFKKSFMPNLNKFTIWEDFINPFFTGLGVNIVAFGLFFVMAVVLCLYAWFSFSNSENNLETEMLKSGNHLNTIIYSTETNKPVKGISESELQTMVNQTRLREMESVFGKNHLADDEQLKKLINSVMRLTIYYQVPVCLLFILGVLYFPAVCLTVGNMHSVGKINFTIGLKTMKKLGFDYLKILLMCFSLITISIAAIWGLYLIFSNLELPIAGIFSAIVVGSFFVFYFWTVFSGLLGITFCKVPKMVKG